jgi:hypothetical protein
MEARTGGGTAVITALRILRQENCEFKASLGYLAGPYLKKKEK